MAHGSSRGTRHGEQFDFSPLIAALQTYIDKFSGWNSEQRKQHWGNVVGGAQRQLPMHAVQEYCRTDRSFDPCPDFSKGARGREFKVRMYYGGTWHDNQVFKRSHWFPTSGAREEWDGDEKLGWFRAAAARGVGWVTRVPAIDDGAAIDDLSNVRKQQFRALGESLSQAPHMRR